MLLNCNGKRDHPSNEVPPPLPSLDDESLCEIQKPAPKLAVYPSTTCCNNTRPTMSVLQMFSKVLFGFYEGSVCLEYGCNLCVRFRHNGRLTRKCRYHSCEVGNVVPGLEAKSREYWAELKLTLEQMLEIPEYSDYLNDPMSQNGLVGRNILRNFSIAKGAIEAKLQQTAINSMGIELEGSPQVMKLNKIVLNFSQMVDQPQHHRVPIPNKAKLPKKKATTTTAAATGLRTVLVYLFAPLVITLLMETIGIDSDLINGEMIIEVTKKVMSKRDSYKFTFDSIAVDIIGCYMKRLKNGRRKKAVSPAWRKSLHNKLSLTVWATRFFLDSFFACGAFGTIDSLINLLSVESNANHGNTFDKGKDIEYITSMAILSYFATIKTKVVVNKAVKESIGNKAPAICTDCFIRDTTGVFQANLITNQMKLLELLFLHGFMGIPSLSNFVIEQFPVFSEIITRREAGNQDFVDLVNGYLVSIMQCIPGVDHFDKEFVAIIIDLVLDGKRNVRTIPFFYFVTIASYLCYALPQLKRSGEVFYRAVLVRDGSKDQRAVQIADRRGAQRNGLATSAEHYQQFNLTEGGFAVYPCHTSTYVLRPWNQHEFISTTPNPSQEIARPAFSFDFHLERPLITCLPSKERIQELLVHCRCLVLESGFDPRKLADATTQLGLSRANIDLMQTTVELLIQARNSRISSIDYSACVAGNEQLTADAAVEAFALLDYPIPTNSSKRATDEPIPNEGVARAIATLRNENANAREQGVTATEDDGDEVLSLLGNLPELTERKEESSCELELCELSKDDVIFFDEALEKINAKQDDIVTTQVSADDDSSLASAEVVEKILVENPTKATTHNSKFGACFNAKFGPSSMGF